VPTGLADRLRAILTLDPDAPAVEFDSVWMTWGDLARIAGDVRTLVATAGPDGPVAVGVLLANRPEIVGAALGVLLGDGCIVTINPHQGDAGLAADVGELRPPVVVARREDWQRPALADVVTRLELAGIEVVGSPEAGARAVRRLEQTTADDYRVPEAGVAVEMLTSGTTGPPKRVPLPYAGFERTIAAAGEHYRASGEEQDDTPRLRSGVALVTSPLVHMSGIFRMLLNLCEGRRIALLERFGVTEWVELVRRHRPRAVSLVPTALAMVYDAGVDREVFESIQVVTAGTAPLSPELQQRFEERYDVAVLPSYGATEFAGGVAGWTLPLHREWIDRKRGSVGRPQPGRRVRVVAPDSGEPVEAGTQGVIEVGTGDDGWVRTADLGRIDDDGFVWNDGRTDDAILRGGFKIAPSEVVAALRSHPAVRDAGVVGLSDERLGRVPVAAVELHSGASATSEELIEHAAEHLAGYKVPAQLLIVDELPRTPSLKVSGPGVQALFEDGLRPPAPTSRPAP
jgi:acyl-CoA synthetase (AMP-forming)/AMP-acid ligase II